MKKSLLSNIPLKLMSVLVAVVVWLLVVNIDDPLVTKTVPGVVVKVQNEAYVESAGQMCLIPENQDIVSVEITGKRSVVDKVKAEDITAIADLEQIVDKSTTPIMVPISVSCAGIMSGNIKSIPQNMRISLDDMMTQEFLITVSAGDTQPGKGYEMGTVEAVPEKVKITGPQSLIQKVDKVIAPIDVTDRTSDYTAKANLRIIDKNQDELSNRQMGYLKYDITSPVVDVNVHFWRIKNDVRLQADYVGWPADGYKVEKITLTPDVVSVAGTEEALSQLTAIEIPKEYIDVSGQSEDFEVKINIEKLLPDDIILTKDTNDTISATISVLPQDTQEYSISTKSIQALNVSTGLQVVYETDSIKIRVREGTQELNRLIVEDMKASIDFTDIKAGSYDLPVTISLPEGYEMADTVSTSVKLVENGDAAANNIE